MGSNLRNVRNMPYRHSARTKYSMKMELLLPECTNRIKGSRCDDYKVFEKGSGGGTRAMAFCLGRPGSTPGLDFGFFQNCCQSILTGCWAFSNNV